MNNLKARFTQIPEYDLPKRLHGRIMRSVMLVHLRTPLVVLYSLLCLNLLISGWRVWQRMANLETFSIMRALFDGFDVSYNFLHDFVLTAMASVPFTALTIFLVNLFLLSYIAVFSFKLRKAQLSKGRALYSH